MARESKVFLDVRMEDEVSGVFESIQESAKETADVLKDYFGEGSDVFNSVLKGLESQDDIIRRIRRMVEGSRFAKEMTFAEYESKLIAAYKSGRLSLQDLKRLREESRERQKQLATSSTGENSTFDQYEENLKAALKAGRLSQKDYNILMERNKARRSENPFGYLDGAKFYPADLIEKLSDEYYDRMRFADKNYIDYRKSLIDEDVLYFKKALGDKFDEAKYRLEMERQIHRDYIKWLKAEYPQLAKILAAFISQPKEKEEKEEEPKRINQAKAFRDRLTRNQFGEVNRLNKEYLDSFTDAVAESFGIMRIRLDENALEIAQIWANMINRMLGALQGLIAEWLVLNSLAAIFGLGGFGSVSFQSLLGIPKLAGGGDIVVPPGFPNDSYPILVQSGERVRVTPAGSTGSESRLLGEIRDALYAINLNRTGRGADSVQVKLYVDGREVVRATEPARKKMQREGRGIST